MDRAVFEKAQSAAALFKYSAFNYTDYNDIVDYTLQTNNDHLVLIYGYNREAKTHEYIWAANDSSVLIDALKYSDDFILSFVPKAWVSPLESAGLSIRNAWHDYYLHDLQKKEFNTDCHYNFLKSSEIFAASQITLECKGQSRGFTGQSPQFFSKWLSSNDIRNTAVLVSRTGDNMISGLVCVGLYGHDSKNGPIVWIREAAVSPKHQSKGIGKTLVSQALCYGRERGASKAFLAVDEHNINAIRLYESLGFQSGSEDSEITMVYTK